MISDCDLLEIKDRAPYQGRKHLLSVYYAPNIVLYSYIYLDMEEHVITFKHQNNQSSLYL
jgi:hypothetical protein